MKNLHKLTLIFLWLTLCNLLNAATIETNNSGYWNSPGTWLGGVIPTAGDDVVIKAAHTVTLSDTRMCTNVSVSGTLSVASMGNLDASGTVTVTGVLTMSGGVVDFTSVVTNDGEFIFNSGTYTFGSGVNFVASAIFRLTGGTVSFNSGSVLASALFITNGTLNDNVGLQPGAVQMSNGTYQGTGSPVFANGFTWNYGTIGGSGIASFTGALTINSSGVTVKDSKELHISDDMIVGSVGVTLQNDTKIRILSTGSLISNGNSSGNITGTSTNQLEVQSGGAVSKTGGGSFSINVPFTITNGSISIPDGTLSVGGSGFTHSFTNSSISIDNGKTLSLNGNNASIYNLSGTTVSGLGTMTLSYGTLNIDSGSSVSSKLTIYNGTLNDNVGIQPGAVLMGSGIYQGTGSPVFANGFTWNGGTIGGSGIASFTGVLTINSSGVTVKDSKELHISNVMNVGEVGVTLQNDTKIRILSGGTLISNGSSSGNITGASTNQLEVQSGGEISKTGGGSFYINVPFTITNGSINVTGGTLSVGGAGFTHSFTNSSISIDNGKTLALNYSVFNFSGTSVSGAGTLNIYQGTTSIESGSSVTSKLTISGGTVNDNVGIQPGTVLMNSGTYQGTGSPLFANGFTWNSGTIGGSGIASFTGVLTINYSSVTVKDSKELHISNDMIVGDVTVILQNDAKIRILSTGSLISNGSSNITGTSTNQLEVQSGGSVSKSGGGSFSINVPFSITSGSINVTGGTLSVGGAGFTHSFTNSSISIDNGKTLALNYSVFNFSGTSVSGAGTLNIYQGTTSIESGSSVTSKLTISGGTFNDNVGIQPGAVLMSGGLYQGTGSPVFANGFTWNSGIIGGSGIASFTGALTINSSNVTVKNSKELHISNVMNVGEVTVILLNDTKIRVLNGGNLTSIGNYNAGRIYGESANQLEVQSGGTVSKTGGGSFRIDVPFSITNGSISITGGTYLLVTGAGFTHSFTNSSISIDNGKSLSLSTSVFNFSGTSVSGAGTLTLGAATLNIESGCSVTSKLTVSGTLNDNVGLQPGEVLLSFGTYQGTGSPVFANGFTWNSGTIGGSGIASFTGVLTINSISSIVVKDSKELHISSDMNVVEAGVTLQNDAKIRILSGGHLNLINSSDYIYGTVSNLLEVQVGGTITKTSTGSFAINSSFSNSGLVIVNTGSLGISTAATHSGNFTTGAGTQLSFSNTTTNSTITGNITNNGTINTGGSTSLIMGGSTLQTISGNGSSINNMTVDNPAGIEITGSQTFTTLHLTSGNVFMQDGDVTVSTTLSGAGLSRYFVTEGAGRLIQPVTTSPKVFHVGADIANYTPVTLQTVSGTSSFGVRVQQGFDYPTGGSDYVDRQWTIDRTTGSSSANVTLQWNTSNEQGSFNSGNCHVSRWDGTKWNHFGDGAASCGSGSCTRTAAAVANFSPFGVASYTSLPVELLSFNVQKHSNRSSLLVWQTSSEYNNQGFDIERSTDAKNWEVLYFQPSHSANGLSNKILDYQYEDASPAFGINYYRLKQKDFDGSFSYSPVRSIEFSNAAGSFNIYPNPVREVLNIQIADFEDYEVKIFDYSGRVMENYTREGNRIEVGSLASGVYYIQLTDRTIGVVASRIFLKN